MATDPKNKQYYVVKTKRSIAITIQRTRPILIKGRTINNNHAKLKKSMGAILVHHSGPFLQ